MDCLDIYFRYMNNSNQQNKKLWAYTHHEMSSEELRDFEYILTQNDQL